jgi:formate/nitrite transporter FocA (FNT family)
MTGQAKFGTGTYIWKSIIASALGNFVGAAMLILPLVYMHGRDDQNPSTVSVQEHIGGSPSGTFIFPKSHANDVEKAV